MTDKIKVREKKTGAEIFVTRKAYEYIKADYIIVTEEPRQEPVPNGQLPVAPLASVEAAVAVDEVKEEQKKRGRKPSQPKPVENEA